MPSTFGTYEIGKSALFAQMRALTVVGHNIANADTPEYARQRPDIISNASETLKTFSDEPYKGQIGSGVTLQRITQYRDSFLDSRLRSERSDREYASEYSNNLQQVEYILGELSDSSIRTGLNDFFDSVADVVENPTSTSTREVLKERGVLIADFFGKTYDDLTTLQQDIDTVMTQQVGAINGLAGRIANLNREISITKAQGVEPNDLRDHRELALKELSEIVDITVEYDSLEKAVVRIGARELVNRDQVNELKIVGNNTNDGLMDVRWADERDSMSNNTDVVTVWARPDAQIRNYTITVNTLATAQELQSSASFAGINEKISSAIPGATSGSLEINGKSFYVDVDNMSLRDLVETVNKRNAGVEASWVDIGGGNYTLGIKSVNTGIVNVPKIGSTADTSNLWQSLGVIGAYGVDGKGVTLPASETVAAQDANFDLFDGVKTTNFTFSHNLIDDSTVISDVALHLRGPGTTYLGINPFVGSGQLKALLDVRDYDINAVKDGLDQMAFELATRVNDFHFEGFGLSGSTQQNFFDVPTGSLDTGILHSQASRFLKVNGEILADTSKIAASTGKIVGSNPLPEMVAEGNSENMLRIYNLKDAKVLKNGTANLYEQFTAINAEVGISANNADRTVENKDYVMTNLDAKRQETMGVNLDEEMVDMLKYQQSYAAASRFISSFDKMVEALIGMV
ncbi:MAG: flagellar hook-associated protein FlgK [Candidatus Wallbacteria bacterium HGW-Wallbacteria-1]|jgi:flagellar hook-associated protein 1 FlgK|uniref:Flagellar hook-associated protein 1 n=1 Tax=Candidatus Wallbacteria bacterium HGW-Wallbacteria-1 TaxID=2013854 RepID=A0A2N1PUH1_9BACT|nr:MAG: flagellar hook-associated protein FlgK [Candidatus Wallbacteria bacterium HGW-Wallbacteria-1]